MWLNTYLLQANEVYVTMKSVLEALSGKLHVAASPSQSVAPPSSTSECHIYDYVPTNRTSAYRQQIQVPVTTSGNGMYYTPPHRVQLYSISPLSSLLLSPSSKFIKL